MRSGSEYWWRLACVLLGMLLMAGCHRPDTTFLDVARVRAKAMADIEVVRASPVQEMGGAGVIDKYQGQVTWWRLTLRRDIAGIADPQLVIGRTYPSTVDVWMPGADVPQRFGLNEPGAFLSDVRALSVPIPAHVHVGDQLFLRIASDRQLQMPVSVVAGHAAELADEGFLAVRWSIFAALAILSLLSISHAFASRERAYGWLGLFLLFELLYLMVDAGEVRWIPLLRTWSDGAHLRNAMVSSAVIAAGMFCRNFLDMRRDWPRADKVMLVCMAGMVIAFLAGLPNWSMAAPIGNLSIVVMCAVIILGAIRGIRAARSDATLLLLAWMPLLVAVLVRIGEMQHWWWLPASFDTAFGTVFVFAGLMLNLALSGKLRLFRLERDTASQEARMDPLTGAVTRKAIEQALADGLQAARARREPFCVAFLDVDAFKPINDTHGHPVGDACLRFVARRLRGRLRAIDLLGRYGGDEFLVLMPGTHLVEARERSERLLQSVNCRPIAIEALVLDCTLSIGVAEWDGSESMDRLLTRADQALYISKNAGRNRVTGIATDGLVVG